MTMPPARAPAPQGRLWRWGRRALAGITVALLSIVLAMGGLLWGLDGPWVKPRLRALVRAQAGIDVDYGATQVHLLSGLRINDLVVRAPAPTAAPDLARVRTLAV